MRHFWEKENMPYIQDNFWSRIKHSILQDPVRPGTGRERKWAAFGNLILHLHPRKVPVETLRFTLTWGLGGMSFVLVLLLALTGILLLFVYEPFPGRAYDSVLKLQNEVLFGQLVRNIHHWSGNFLVLVAFLHLLRVFFTGAFHNNRQFNWIICILLFNCVFISNFTGYLLPWDQLAFWAITICTSMIEYIPGIGTLLQRVIIGGSEIGPSTLLNFFTVHTTVIPVCLVILLPIHFWRIRKAGGVIIPRSSGEAQDSKPTFVSTIPNLVLREAVVALALIAFIMVYSIMFNAPLGAEANPGLSPNPTRAPWYFSGIQEMMLHFHPLFAVFIIPVIFYMALLLLPYMKYDSPASGFWFHSQKGRQTGVVTAVSALIITPIAIIADEFFINFTAWMPGISPTTSNGLIPIGFVAAAIIGFYMLMKKKYAASNNETVQMVFVLLLVAFVIFTITGIWFRGEGMALVWPGG
jgi:quinol-cytochrome oxidoreductase complex cytochrome b subunit